MNRVHSLNDTQLTAMKWALLASGIFCIYLGTMAIDLQKQMILGWGMVAIIAVMKQTRFIEQPLFKIFILTMVTFVSARYLLWRMTDTLVYTYFIEFFFVALVFIAEIEVAVVHILGIFSNAWPLNRSKGPPIPDDINLVPTVDVYLPTYNEPEELVEITALAAIQLDYPKEKLRVHILDDGATEAKRAHEEQGPLAWHRYHRLKEFCEEHGINYIARPTNDEAKAGNVNYAMAHTDGELLLCLDCDHVPTRDFLQNTIGYFIEDPKLFLVQTPHFFINPDPVEKSLNTHHRAPGENEMFFRGSHPGIDLWNASFFCGSAAVLRRTCLDEAGGFAGETITEDAETSIQLHAKGYHSVYVKKPMVCGLSPETFGDFIIQRSRWCQGMLQIGFLKNPMKMRGLSLAQKICYSSFYMFWFFGLARVVFFLAPALFILLDLHIYNASSKEVIAYALPHLVVSLMAADILYGRYRWPLFSELYESVQSLFLVKAVLSVVKNPRAPTFKVTPKGQHLDHDLLSPLSGPFYLLFFIMLLGVPTAVYRFIEEPLLRDVILLCSCWLLLNIVLAIASLGAFWDKHQIRKHHRAWATGPAKMHLTKRDMNVAGTITDLSLTGMGIRVDKEVRLHQNEELLVEHTDSYGEKFLIKAKIVRLIKLDKMNICGLEFLDYDEQRETLIRFVYGDSKRWSDFWNREEERPGISYSFYYLLKMGFKGLSTSMSGMKIMLLYWGRILQENLQRLMRQVGLRDEA